MKAWWIIAKREFTSSFISPIAYVALLTFAVFVTWLFFRGFFVIGQADLRPFFHLAPWVFLFLVPAIAMGRWAEERKQGTLEVLLTLPVRDRDLVFGKFLGGLLFLLAALALTLPLPLTVSLLGNLDFGPVMGGYLGLLALGAIYLAIGLVISSLTENQIIAFIVTVMVSFLLFMIGTPLISGGRGGWFPEAVQYFGIGIHYESISRGVLDTRDLVYALSLIGFLLFLNTKLIRDRARQYLPLATLFLLFVVVNLVVARFPARIDLTEEKIYTLSKTTEQLLEELDDIVTIRVYFSRNLPAALLPHKRSVDDLLSEFKRGAGRRLQIEYRDPTENQMEEQKLAMMGIPAVQINVIEEDRQEVAKIYLGMAILFGEKQEVLPVVQQISTLEYDMAQAILKVSTNELPKVGWLEVMPEEEEVRFQGIRSAISKRTEIISVLANEPQKIDRATFQTLVVLAAHPMEKKLVEALDRFLRDGGGVVLLADRWRIGPGLRPERIESKLFPWLLKQGVTLHEDFVLDRSNAMAAFSGGMITYHLAYPYWIRIRPEGFAQEIPMVADLESLVFPWTSPLTLDQGVTPLASTTASGVKVPASPLPILSPDQAEENLRQGNGVVSPLAALMTRGEGRMVVAGTTRLVDDRFLELFPSNALFLENGVDTLSWGETLIGIRSRGTTGRPLLLLEESGRFLLRAINLAAGPLILFGIGVTLFALRRRKHRRLRLEFQRG